MVDSLPEKLINLVVALVGGTLVYAIHEFYHLVAGGMASAAVVDNVGSVALGLLAVAGYYLITKMQETDLEEVVAGATFVVTAGAHSLHHFLQPTFIGMAELMALVGFIGALLLTFLPELE